MFKEMPVPSRYILTAHFKFTNITLAKTNTSRSMLLATSCFLVFLPVSLDDNIDTLPVV